MQIFGYTNSRCTILPNNFTIYLYIPVNYLYQFQNLDHKYPQKSHTFRSKTLGIATYCKVLNNYFVYRSLISVAALLNLQLLSTNIVILVGTSPSSYSGFLAGFLMLNALVVIANGSGSIVAASNPSCEVKLVFHLNNSYVIVHPSDIVILMTIENVV